LTKLLDGTREELDMGQAKLRGTKEQRVAAAVERDSAARAARQRAEAERLAAMTPAARKAESARKHRARMLTAMLLGVAYALPEPRRRFVPLNNQAHLRD
jgi:hypothetical protein